MFLKTIGSAALAALLSMFAATSAQAYCATGMRYADSRCYASTDTEVSLGSECRAGTENNFNYVGMALTTCADAYAHNSELTSENTLPTTSATWSGYGKAAAYQSCARPGFKFDWMTFSSAGCTTCGTAMNDLEYEDLGESLLLFAGSDVNAGLAEEGWASVAGSDVSMPHGKFEGRGIYDGSTYVGRYVKAPTADGNVGFVWFEKTPKVQYNLPASARATFLATNQAAQKSPGIDVSRFPLPMTVDQISATLPLLAQTMTSSGYNCTNTASSDPHLACNNTCNKAVAEPAGCFLKNCEKRFVGVNVTRSCAAGSLYRPTTDDCKATALSQETRSAQCPSGYVADWSYTNGFCYQNSACPYSSSNDGYSCNYQNVSYSGANGGSPYCRVDGRGGATYTAAVTAITCPVGSPPTCVPRAAAPASCTGGFTISSSTYLPSSAASAPAPGLNGCESNQDSCTAWVWDTGGFWKRSYYGVAPVNKAVSYFKVDPTAMATQTVISSAVFTDYENKFGYSVDRSHGTGSQDVNGQALPMGPATAFDAGGNPLEATYCEQYNYDDAGLLMSRPASWGPNRDYRFVCPVWENCPSGGCGFASPEPVLPPTGTAMYGGCSDSTLNQSFFGTACPSSSMAPNMTTYHGTVSEGIKTVGTRCVVSGETDRKLSGGDFSSKVGTTAAGVPLGACIAQGGGSFYSDALQCAGDAWTRMPCSTPVVIGASCSSPVSTVRRIGSSSADDYYATVSRLAAGNNLVRIFDNSGTVVQTGDETVSKSKTESDTAAGTSVTRAAAFYLAGNEVRTRLRTTETYMNTDGVFAQRISVSPTEAGGSVPGVSSNATGTPPSCFVNSAGVRHTLTMLAPADTSLDQAWRFKVDVYDVAAGAPVEGFPVSASKELYDYKACATGYERVMTGRTSPPFDSCVKGIDVQGAVLSSVVTRMNKARLEVGGVSCEVTIPWVAPPSGC